jgi:hypothetical protein
MTEAETLETLAMLSRRILVDRCSLTLSYPSMAEAPTIFAMLASPNGCILAIAEAPDLTNAIRFALEAARNAR